MLVYPPAEQLSLVLQETDMIKIKIKFHSTTSMRCWPYSVRSLLLARGMIRTDNRRPPRQEPFRETNKQTKQPSRRLMVSHWKTSANKTEGLAVLLGQRSSVEPYLHTARGLDSTVLINTVKQTRHITQMWSTSARRRQRSQHGWRAAGSTANKLPRAAKHPRNQHSEDVK